MCMQASLYAQLYMYLCVFMYVPYKLLMIIAKSSNYSCSTGLPRFHVTFEWNEMKRFDKKKKKARIVVPPPPIRLCGWA